MSVLFGNSPGSYGYVPYNTLLNTLTNAISICCWCNCTTLNAAGEMIINRQVAATPGNEWWSLNTYNNVPRALIGNGTSVTAVSDPTAITANTWYHLTMTFDGTNIVLYTNGIQVGTGTRTMTFSSDTTGVVIGANAQGAGDTSITEFFQGYIEDIRVYNKVLTVNEILTIMNCGGRDYIYQGLIFRYLLNEKSTGTTASGAGSFVDSGMYGLHATPNGSCVYGDSRLLIRQPSIL